MTADGEEDELEKKHQGNSVPLVMAKSSPSLENRTVSFIQVDATILQYQNQRLVQQLDAQKHETHILKGRFNELKAKQTTYDDTLITFNRAWNQLISDLILLGVRAGAYESSLEALDHADFLGGLTVSCPSEKLLLCRLLERNDIESNDVDAYLQSVMDALISRHSSTMALMKCLKAAVDAHTLKFDCSALPLNEKLSAEDSVIQLKKISCILKEYAGNLHKVIDTLHSKHKLYADEIQRCLQSHSSDQAEIECLAGKLEESITELEECRRKLVNLNMLKRGVPGLYYPDSDVVNGVNSLDQPEEKTMDLQVLKDSVEEAEMVSAVRLSELQVAQEENLALLEQLQTLQSKLEDDKHVLSSKPCTLLSDHLEHLKSELEKYKELTDTLQADKNGALRNEMELNLKLDLKSTIEQSISDAETKMHDLEVQLQRCILERNDLEVKMEEAVQDLGKGDIQAEFRAMAAALLKEMELMEKQLIQYKEIDAEALSLHDEVCALKSELDKKTSEFKSFSAKHDEQLAEIKTLKKLIEDLKGGQQEMETILDMYGQQCFDIRDLMEIKESERRARAQAEILKRALDENSLELRVRAANDVEAACEDRLSAAENETADLKAKLDITEREVMHLREAIEVKDEEAELYIAEIETIGQAYEDMQTQNPHLLLLVTERDDYNIKLVSESVKIKQAQSCLLSEKLALSKQLQLVISSLDFHKSKVAQGEEQMKALFAQANDSYAENRRLSMNLETLTFELAEAEKELKWLKSTVILSEKEYDQNQHKMLDLEEEIEHERLLQQRLDVKLRELNDKVAEMSLDKREAMVQNLQDEIKECKAILKCGVCFDRPKEVVITKCYHLFCNVCIQRNLEIRHRKCPGCGTPFGQSDVRQVNI